MSSIIAHCYDSEYMATEDSSEGLHLWCLGRDSTPIHILIKQTPIYLFIELPESSTIQTWDENSASLLFEDLKKTHGRCSPFMFDFTERQKLYYYNGDRKTPMMRLYFKTTKDMNICYWRLTKTQYYESFGNLIFRIFEKDISIRRKVFTIQKTRFSQWFELRDAKEIPFTSKERMAVRGKPGREIREFIADDYRSIFPIPASESASWVTKPRILSYDIETYTDNWHSLPDKTNPNHVIWMISCLFQVTGEKDTREKYVIQLSDCEDIKGATIIKAKDEEELIVLFLQLIEELDPEILTGYNIFSYDNPYIDARYSMYRECYEPCSRLIGHIPEISNMTWASGAYGTTTICYLKLPGRIWIDLFPIIKRDYKLDKYTLDFVSKEFLGASKHDMSAVQMFQAYESKDIKKMTKVTEYCIQDSNLVIDLYEKMNVWIGLVELSNIVGVEIMEIFTRGQQIRCVSQIYNLTHHSKIVLDSRDNVEMDYKGGFVAEPIVGIHENVIVLDFSSLYPSIMRAYNICYTTLVPEISLDEYDLNDIHTIEVESEEGGAASGDRGIKFHFVKDYIRKGVLPTLVENLVNERNVVRREMKKIEEKIEILKEKSVDSSKTLNETLKDLELNLTVLDKRQLGLKVSANSMYGFLGVQTGGKLPLMEGAISITSKGRQLITEVNDYLIKTYNATIVYNDTDSSMIQIPEIESRAEAYSWGHRLAAEISGIPEILDAEGNIVQHAVKGLFPPPLKMEFEKAMRFIGITKKKYAGFLIAKDGSFEVEKNGDEKIYKRGIVIARRDNFPYLRKIYTNVLRSILRKIPIEDTFNMILDAVLEILSGKLPPRGNLTLIKGLGKEYASDTYFLKIFSDELSRMGHPVSAGDRLEYIVVKNDDPKIPLGRRIRLIEMYEDSISYDEKINGSRPENVYPVEEIDYLYYITNGLQNPIDQLFSAGYRDTLYKTTLYETGYTPGNSKSKMVRIATPIKVITTLIKDKMRKNDFTLQDCIEFLDGDFRQWFLDELENAKPIEKVHEIEDIIDGDEDGLDEDGLDEDGPDEEVDM